MKSYTLKYKGGDKVYIKNEFDLGIPTPGYYTVISCNKTHVHIINNANSYYRAWVKLEDITSIGYNWKIK